MRGVSELRGGSYRRGRSAFMPQRLAVGALCLVLTGLSLVTCAGTAGASTPTYFGAKLTVNSQPSNAEDGYACHESGGIPKGADCTWVALTAFENGSNYTAPVTGTIKHVKLISCIAGSFRLELARAVPSKNEARIVSRGPIIKYTGQTTCDNTFKIQSFAVKVHVEAGEYIAIDAKSTGTLSCSGGSGVLLYSPPLKVGGKLTKARTGASCDMLIQLSYK